MTILEYYKYKHGVEWQPVNEHKHDKIWPIQFLSSADNNYGKLYFYTDTNFRTTLSFIKQFNRFLPINGLARENWERNDNHGQEKDKQRTVRLSQSKLFCPKTIDGKKMYKLTAKGEAFKDFVDNLENNCEDDTKRAIIYLFLQGSYFDMTPNYIHKQTTEILDSLTATGYNYDNLSKDVKTILSDEDRNFESIIKHELFWILSFCRDKDFLLLFSRSSKKEKQELIDYCTNNYNSKTYSDCISYKYKPQGTYAVATFYDELIMFYITSCVLQTSIKTFDEFLNEVINQFKFISNIDENLIRKFTNDHSDIFSCIFEDMYGIHEDEYENAITQVENIISNKKIDDTTSKNAKFINQVRSALKKMAKEAANYKCELEPWFNCHYFTSRENDKNYLEIHHLIPREFSNEFENSIEIPENYVALCPSCHRLLHFGTDRERESAINYLFNKREKSLRERGIIISINDLKRLYGIKISQQ